MIRDGEARAFGRFTGSRATQGVYSVASDNFDVRHYRCEWQVDPAVQYINGAITTEFIIRQTSDTIVFDINKALTVDSILYHGANILFQQTANDGLTVNFPSSINKGTIDSVTVFYQGIPDASGFGSFYQGTHSGVPVIWTLSEPFGARDWWPCKNGLNDKADSIDIIVTYPQQYLASSNGLVVGEQADAVNRLLISGTGILLRATWLLLLSPIMS